MALVIYAEVTAQVSEGFLENIVSNQGRHKEAFFSEIAKEAGLNRSYKGGGTSWFLQGDFDSVTRAHGLLGSLYEVVINAEGKVPTEQQVQGFEAGKLIGDDIIGIEGNNGCQTAGLNLNLKKEDDSSSENEMTIVVDANDETVGGDERLPEERISYTEHLAETEDDGRGLKLRIRKSGRKCKSTPRKAMLSEAGSDDEATRPKKTRQSAKNAVGRRRKLKETPSSKKQPKPEPEEPQQTQGDVVERVFRNGGKTCKICQKAFSKISNLYRHMKVAHQGQKFACSLCEKKFTCKDSLERHRKIVHDGLRCLACTMVFDRQEDLEEHQGGECPGDKSKLETFPCPECKRTYSRQSNLNKHVRVAHNGVMFSCEFCGRGYRSKEGLHEHQRHVHDSYKCSRCNAVCECELDFKHHMEDVHQENYTLRTPPKRKDQPGVRGPKKRERRKATCEYCGKIYSSQSKLNNHVLVIHHHIRQHCEHCKKSFASKEQLKIHRRVFHEGLTTTCSLCGRSFVNRATLAKHQLSVHKQLVMDNVYQCEICGKSFLYECNLCRHKKLDHEGVRFHCSQCGKEFRTKQKMQEHSKVQHDGERFHCATCPKLFKNKSKLKEHEISAHTNLKPHECFECGEKFARRSSLNYHTKKKHTAGGIPTFKKPRTDSTAVKHKKPKRKTKDQSSTQGKKESKHAALAPSENVMFELDNPLYAEEKNGVPSPEQEHSQEQEPLFSRGSIQIAEPLITLAWDHERGAPVDHPTAHQSDEKSQPQHLQQAPVEVIGQNFNQVRQDLGGVYLPPVAAAQIADVASTPEPEHHPTPTPAPADSRQPESTVPKTNTLETMVLRNNSNWSAPLRDPVPQPSTSVTHSVGLMGQPVLVSGEPSQSLYNQALHNLLAQCMPSALGAPPTVPQPQPQPQENAYLYSYQGLVTSGMSQNHGHQQHPQ